MSTRLFGRTSCRRHRYLRKSPHFCRHVTPRLSAPPICVHLPAAVPPQPLAARRGGSSWPIDAPRWEVRDNWPASYLWHNTAFQHESRAAFQSRLLGLQSHKGRLFTVLDGLEEAGLRAGTSALLSARSSQEEGTGTPPGGDFTLSFRLIRLLCNLSGLLDPGLLDPGLLALLCQLSWRQQQDRNWKRLMMTMTMGAGL